MRFEEFAMQNIDFYERKNIRFAPPQFSDNYDPEYLPRMAQHTPREMERVKKKASRIFFLITSLCIMSFTAGILLGTKFTGGSQRAIIDKKTFNAVADMGNTLPLFSKEKPAEAAPKEKLFPKESYPYVIMVSNEYSHPVSQKIAEFLSRRGHTVIISKNNSLYRIYIGPYKSGADAQKALKKISSYNKYSLAENTRIIKR
jgi:hypothetical protein